MFKNVHDLKIWWHIEDYEGKSQTENSGLAIYLQWIFFIFPRADLVDVTNFPTHSFSLFFISRQKFFWQFHISRLARMKLQFSHIVKFHWVFSIRKWSVKREELEVFILNIFFFMKSISNVWTLSSLAFWSFHFFLFHYSLFFGLHSWGRRYFQCSFFHGILLRTYNRVSSLEHTHGSRFVPSKLFFILFYDFFPHRRWMNDSIVDVEGQGNS